MIGVRFSVVEREEEGSKAIDWDEEGNRANRGCADRVERKRIKKERKGAMAEQQREQQRIRGQVGRFLAYLAGLDNQVMELHLSVRVVADILREWIGNETLQVCIDTFSQRFITPGNDVDLDDEALIRLQQIMMEFMLRDLFEDPVSASPNAAG
mmetsp:Transcript_1070/g.2951  ORF Transcript_1070/g.2951 Transcript_1070/m.2951 type:complete len:154 (-) Transcript_1070:539-1000(-)